MPPKTANEQSRAQNETTSPKKDYLDANKINYARPITQ